MKSFRPTLVRTLPAAAPSALPRKTLVETAVNALRQRIIDGEFQAGESLNQVAIAREYAISRIPLREAMRQLEVEGLLLFQPGKGAVVSGLSLSEIQEVIDLRAMIEPDLLDKAIPRLTTADLERAKRILDDYETAFKKNEVATWGEYNWRFHSTLCAPSGCSIAMGILQSLHHLNERYAKIQISATHWTERAAHEHREILGACVRKDRQKSRRLLKDHIVSAGQALIALLEKHRHLSLKTSTRVSELPSPDDNL